MFIKTAEKRTNGFWIYFLIHLINFGFEPMLLWLSALHHFWPAVAQAVAQWSKSRWFDPRCPRSTVVGSFGSISAIYVELCRDKSLASKWSWFSWRWTVFCGRRHSVQFSDPVNGLDGPVWVKLVFFNRSWISKLLFPAPLMLLLCWYLIF